MDETIFTTDEIEVRRRRARAAAERCIDLLKEEFGAQRVTLFGSLAEQGVWHRHSDIDLAVEGLPAADFFKAYGACHNLVSPEFELDLVPLEDAYPEMRARILGEVEMPDDPLLALQALVDDEFTALRRVEQEMTETLAESSQPPSRIELRAIASLLHEFYNGIERIFERIVVGLGESLPRGTSWHADLLVQMATAQKGKRPAVIDGQLWTRLEEYLKFRYFFRHAYGHTLEWDRLRWNAEQLGDTLEMLDEQIHAFFDNLDQE